MKINFFTLSLSILIGILAAFFLSKQALEKNIIIFTIGSFLSISMATAGVLSLNFAYNKTNVLIKATSFVFLCAFIFIHILFSIFNEYEYSSYVLTTGISIIMFIISIYTISKMKV